MFFFSIFCSSNSQGTCLEGCKNFPTKGERKRSVVAIMKFMMHTNEQGCDVMALIKRLNGMRGIYFLLTGVTQPYQLLHFK